MAELTAMPSDRQPLGSPKSLRRCSLAAAVKANKAELNELLENVEILPKQVIDRFVSPQQDAVIVQGV